MAFSTQREDSDGTLVLLDISIEYFDRSEIAVFFDGVLSTAWSWVGSTEKKISFSPAVPNGVEVMVVRSTDLSELRHMFSSGAAFTTQSLDEALLQILHIAQEARENATIEEVFHNLNMHGYRIVNVGPGVADTDGANMLQMNEAVEAAEAAAQVAIDAAGTIDVSNLLNKTNNLSEIVDDAAARANIGAQVILVSGSNIKTVGGASLLGGGDVPLPELVNDILFVDGVQLGDSSIAAHNFVLRSNTDGTLTLARGNAGATTQDILTVDGAGKVSFPNGGGSLTSGAAINTTSGTYHDFPGIPSWVRRITLTFRGISTNGASPFLVQLGYGSITASGYAAQTWINGAYLRSTAGFPLQPTGNGSYVWSGVLVLVKHSSNMWSADGTLNVPSVDSYGAKTIGDSPELSGALDRIRLTTVNGADVFDGGAINILYE